MFLSVSVFLCVDQDFFAMGNRLLSAGLTYSVYVHLALPKYCACVGACVWLCGGCLCVCVRGPLSVQLSMNKVKTEQDVQLCTCVGKEWNDCFDYLPIARPSFCFSV